MTTINSDILKKYFNFLLSIFNFKLKEIKSYDYALYTKFLSSSVGIYFIYEFRDSIPQIQFTKLVSDELEQRPGLYTLKECYKEENFKLQSFYLDEIIQFKKGKEYNSCFKDVKTIEDAIKISAELIEQYAKDFVIGDKKSYDKMNVWFRNYVMLSSTTAKC
jgi:hypothetical protein